MTTFSEYSRTVPEIYRDATLKDAWIPEISKQIIRTWLENGEGMMTFHGDTGRYKTWTAYAILNDTIKKIELKRKEGAMICFSYYFISIAMLYQHWLSNMSDPWKNENLIHELGECSFLAIDDIGIRCPTDGFYDFFLCIVDQRSMKKRHRTLFTTNCSSDELTKLYGPRFSSRVLFGGQFIKFEGPDGRIKK